jgi:hypothetical protein
MSRAIVLALCAALAAGTAATPALADDGAEFMARFSGKWIGTGQLLLGADNGAEFVCELNGDPSASQRNFGMTGRCRMGTMSAAINAQLRYNADTNEFYGDFLGGAEGDGVDIVGARQGDGFSLRLMRGATQGRLTAEKLDPDQLKVVIYYRNPLDRSELPVVAMGFTRAASNGSDIVTGSITPEN